jgi:hypothetical protein
VDWLVEANVSEKSAAFIFKVEVITSTLKTETAHFSERLTSTNQSTGDLTQKIVIRTINLQS